MTALASVYMLCSSEPRRIISAGDGYFDLAMRGYALHFRLLGITNGLSPVCGDRTGNVYIALRRRARTGFAPVSPDTDVYYTTVSYTSQ